MKGRFDFVLEDKTLDDTSILGELAEEGRVILTAVYSATRYTKESPKVYDRAERGHIISLTAYHVETAPVITDRKWQIHPEVCQECNGGLGFVSGGRTSSVTGVWNESAILYCQKCSMLCEAHDAEASLMMLTVP